MKKEMFRKSLIILPFLYGASANAALLDLNYSNFGLSAGGDAYNSVSISSGAISANIEAYIIENDGVGNISNLSLISTANNGVYVSSTTSGNVGVKSSSTDGSNLDGASSHDSTDVDEGLLFTFNQAVSLDYINFDYFGTSDDFNLTVDGVSIFADYNADSSALGAVNNTSQFDEYTFNNIVGTEFLIWADGSSDGFRIDRLEVSAVPVPAAVWLFGSGLLGLAGFARRKNT